MNTIILTLSPIRCLHSEVRLSQVPREIDKTLKNTAVAAELFELSFCTFGIAPENELSRQPQAQYGSVPKLSRYSGKNSFRCAPLKKLRTAVFIEFKSSRDRGVQEVLVF